MADNRGQVCSECGTVNKDPLANYLNEDGIMACSHRCYAALTNNEVEGEP